MCGGLDVQKLSTPDLHDDKDVQELKTKGHGDCEIASHDRFGVIAGSENFPNTQSM